MANLLASEVRELRRAANLSADQAVALLPAEERISADCLLRFETEAANPHPRNLEAIENLAGLLRLKAAGGNPTPARLKKIGPLYATRLVTQTLNYIDYAWKHRRENIWLLVAPWQSGKTCTAEHWRAYIKSCPHFYQETPPSCSYAELVSRLHAAFGLPPVTVSYRRRDAIIDFLRANPMLLLIDQAEELSVRALNELQHIWDRAKADDGAGCAIVLLSSQELLGRLTTKRGAANLGRLRGRISSAVLPLASPEEVMAVATDVVGKRPWKPGAFDRFYLGTGSGCLGKVIRGAQAVNQVLSASGKNGHDPVTTKLLEVALRHLL